MWNLFNPENKKVAEGVVSEKIGSRFPSHKEFCDFIKIFRKDKPSLSKWLSFPLYIICIFSLWTFVSMLLVCILIKGERRNEYPHDKYRKVIRKGILWDNIEYHER